MMIIPMICYVIPRVRMAGVPAKPPTHVHVRFIVISGLSVCLSRSEMKEMSAWTWTFHWLRWRTLNTADRVLCRFRVTSLTPMNRWLLRCTRADQWTEDHPLIVVIIWIIKSEAQSQYHRKVTNSLLLAGSIWPTLHLTNIIMTELSASLAVAFIIRL